MRLEKPLGSGTVAVIFLAIVAVVVMLIEALPRRVEGATPVTIQVQDWNIHDSKYKKKKFQEFSKVHKSINAKYTSIVGGAYDEVVRLALTVGEPPDIFYLPGGFSLESALEKGYIIPLEDLVSDRKELEEWKSRFRPGAFREGINMWKGKTYTWPMQAATDTPYPIFYNKKIFKDAGISLKVGVPPKEPSPWPASWRPKKIVPLVGWDSFLLYARKTTQLGRGSSYGFTWGVKQPWVFEMTIGQSAARLDPRLYYGGLDYSIGRWPYDSVTYKDTVKLFLQLKRDGSIVPGDITMADEDAKRMFGLERAAMQLGYWWNPGGYVSYNPELDFDAFLLVGKDGWDSAPWYSGGVAQGSYYVSSKVPDRKAAWEVIKFMTSLDYFEGWVTGGFGIAPIPEANKPENFKVPTTYYFAHWALEALTPPKPRNPNLVGDIWNLMPAVHPNLREVLEGIWIGKLGLDALDTLTERLNKALDQAVVYAEKQHGTKISLEGNLVFSDWDPFRHY